MYFRNGKLPGGCGRSDTLIGTHLVEKLGGAALSPPYLFPLLFSSLKSQTHSVAQGAFDLPVFLPCHLSVRF